MENYFIKFSISRDIEIEEIREKQVIAKSGVRITVKARGNEGNTLFPGDSMHVPESIRFKRHSAFIPDSILCTQTTLLSKEYFELALNLFLNNDYHDLDINRIQNYYLIMDSKEYLCGTNGNLAYMPYMDISYSFDDNEIININSEVGLRQIKVTDSSHVEYKRILKNNKLRLDKKETMDYLPILPKYDAQKETWEVAILEPKISILGILPCVYTKLWKSPIKIMTIIHLVGLMEEAEELEIIVNGTVCSVLAFYYNVGSFVIKDNHKLYDIWTNDISTKKIEEYKEVLLKSVHDIVTENTSV
jgi:hypothetical protein